MKRFSGFKNSPLKQGIPPKGSESYPDYLKRAFKETKDPYAQDVHDKTGYKKAKKTVRKKAIKKVAGKIASRAIPGVGWALAASDAYGMGKKMYKGASFKDAAKEQFLGIKSKNK